MNTGSQQNYNNGTNLLNPSAAMENKFLSPNMGMPLGMPAPFFQAKQEFMMMMNNYLG